MFAYMISITKTVTLMQLAAISSSTNLGNRQFEWILSGLPVDNSGTIIPCELMRKSHTFGTAAFAFGWAMRFPYWSSATALSTLPSGSILRPCLTSWLVSNTCWKLRVKLPAFCSIYGCWFSRRWNYISELNALYLNTPRLCLYKYYSKGRYHVERSFLGAVLYFGWPNQSFLFFR